MESGYYTEPPPLHHPSLQLDPQNKQIPRPFPPHQWDEVFRKKSSVLRNLQSAVLSLHPVLTPSVWVSMDWLVWAVNWKDATSLPPHTPDPSLSPLCIIKKTCAHIFLLLVGTLINIWVVWSVQRGPLLYVWSLYKRLFCLCFPWSYSRWLSILGSRGAQGLTWRIVRRSVGRNLWGFFILHWPIFILLFLLLVVVED